MERSNLHILFNKYFGIGLLLIVLITFTSKLSAQLQQQSSFNNFEHIKNMPKQEVFCITKDQLGFIWIGSTDGLYQLDATNNVQVFKKEQPIIEGGLKSNAIRALLSDSKNNLWIGTTSGGLTKYHQSTGEWSTYQVSDADASSLSNNDVLSILEDSKGRIWVGTEDGLNLFQPDTESFIRFLPNKKDSTALSARAVISIFEDDEQRLWISTWAGGFNLFLPNERNISKSQFRRFDPSEDEVTHNVWKIHQDARGRYWVATIGGGFFLMDLPKEITNDINYQSWMPDFIQFKNDDQDLNSLSNNAVFDIEGDDFGVLWIATANGLNSIHSNTLADPKMTNNFEHYFPNTNNQRSINSEKINFIYSDMVSVNTVGMAISLKN